MDEPTQIRILNLADRLLDLLDKLIERKYPAVMEVPQGDKEVWKKGDPLPEPKTEAEYRDFPAQPGRFQAAIAAAQRPRD